MNNYTELKPFQYGFVVRNAEESAARFAALMGTAPAPVCVYHLDEHWIDGEKRPISFKAVTLRCGESEVELIEPVDSPVHARFLESHGDGFQHIGFRCPDYDGSCRRLEAMGYPKAQEAKFVDGKFLIRAAYYDTYTAVGLMTELSEITELPTEQ